MEYLRNLWKNHRFLVVLYTVNLMAFTFLTGVLEDVLDTKHYIEVFVASFILFTTFMAMMMTVFLRQAGSNKGSEKVDEKGGETGDHVDVQGGAEDGEGK